MIIETHEQAQELAARHRLLESELQSVPQEDITRRNDILLTMDRIDRAICEWREIVELERQEQRQDPEGDYPWE